MKYAIYFKRWSQGQAAIELAITVFVSLVIFVFVIQIDRVFHTRMYVAESTYLKTMSNEALTMPKNLRSKLGENDIMVHTSTSAHRLFLGLEEKKLTVSRQLSIESSPGATVRGKAESHYVYFAPANDNLDTLNQALTLYVAASLIPKLRRSVQNLPSVR